jgi:solute carrier family 25 (mitochondrial S-adenosylmethionine transporter), member 26
MTQIPFTSLQFPLYEVLKIRLASFLNRKLYAHEAAACGSIAGGFAAALTTPLDVVKTRVMLDTRVRLLIPFPIYRNIELNCFFKDSSLQKFPSISSRFVTIYRTEGLSALFAGVVPRTMWISAGGAVFLGVYEAVIHRLTVW